MGYILEKLEDRAAYDNYFNPFRPGKYTGWAILVFPPDREITLNPTAPLGIWGSFYYGTVFWLINNEYRVAKADEWIEISPSHTAFYQKVLETRDALSGKVWKTLHDLMDLTADLELMQHDYRRYKDIADAFKEKDEHRLKAWFVDQVDFYAGEGAPGRLSMSFMQQRGIFPTIIQDFFEMQSEEDLKKHPRLSKLPKVEKDVLLTKWRAYQEWKRLFKREVELRMQHLEKLIRAKKKEIELKRAGIKDKIARILLISRGFTKPAIRVKHKTEALAALRPGAEATSYYFVRIWAWKEFVVPEFYKTPGELWALHPVNPYDDFTKRVLIFNEDIGLKAKYKWITKEWVDEKVEEIKKEGLFITRKRHYTTPVPIQPSPYYVFFQIDFKRYTIALPGGKELEDLTMDIRAFLMSQNILLVKLLEKKAMEEEFEWRIDEMVGTEHKIKGLEKELEKRKEEREKRGDIYPEIKEEMDIKSEYKEKKKTWFPLEKVRDKLQSWFGLKLRLLRRTPYERDWERIKRFYLSPLGRYYWKPLIVYIKSKMLALR